MHSILEMTSDKILNYFILKWITHKLHNFMKNNNSLQNKNNLVRKNGIVLHCFVKPLLSGLDCWILVSIPTFNVLWYHISHAASRKLHCTLLEKWELTFYYLLENNFNFIYPLKGACTSPRGSRTKNCCSKPNNYWIPRGLQRTRSFCIFSSLKDMDVSQIPLTSNTLLVQTLESSTPACCVRLSHLPWPPANLPFSDSLQLYIAVAQCGLHLCFS